MYHVTMAEDPTGAGADPAGFVARLPGWNDRDRVAYLFKCVCLHLASLSGRRVPHFFCVLCLVCVHDVASEFADGEVRRTAAVGVRAWHSLATAAGG